MKNFVAVMAAALLALCTYAAQAQAPSYGQSVNLEQARKVIAAGQVEARKNGWPVAIAVVDNAGMLVAYERMDDTQTASVQVAIDKAVSAAMYRRPTKAFQDLVAGGGAGLRALNLRGASTVEGGLTLVVGGKIVGGVGVSGVNADQDGMDAKAEKSRVRLDFRAPCSLPAT
jgi:glc operon protein GlcG